MDAIALNGHRGANRRVVGNENTTVMVIDDVVVSTDELRKLACTDSNFVWDRRFSYPGVGAQVPDAYVDVVAPEVVALLKEAYDIPNHLEPRIVRRLFSLVTTPAEDLGPLQRVPHFDSLDEFYFATVHYLAPGEFAGTGIFRHRPTGFERVSQNRYAKYVQAAESHMKANGMPPAAYIRSSDEHYELIEELEYRSNRLVIYPGNLLHSGLIEPDRDLSWDPATGRLTANLFIDFKEPGSP